MKFSWKTIAAVICYVLGVVGWLYLGVWMVLTRPVKGLLLAYAEGILSMGGIFKAGVQGFIWLTIAGAVWCIGYILSNYLKEH